MANMNCSWTHSLISGPNGIHRSKIEVFAICHPEQPGQNYSVVATGSIEFPDPVLAKVLLDALSQAVGQKSVLVVPAQALVPQERN